MGNEPLLRSRAPRCLIALLLIPAAGVAMLIGFLSLVAGGGWALTAAALVAVIALPLSFYPVEDGRWSEGSRGTVERVAVALVLALAAGTAGVALVTGVSALAHRDVLGTPPGDIVPWFVLAAVALAGLLPLLASVPLPVGRRSAWRALGVLLAGIVACLATAGTVQGNDRCDGFAFDRARWQAGMAGDVGPLGDDEETLAISSALAACGTLDGLPRTEVVRLLGPPSPNDFDLRRETLEWPVGWINDGLGLGDGQRLMVAFRDGRAIDTSLMMSEYGED